MLQTGIVDRRLGQRTEGIVGNNFSSYVRDYDFSIRLREHAQNHPDSGLPEDFGVLHGNLFKGFLQSEAYTQHFGKPPVICISVSSSRSYHRTENSHPVLGVEYQQDEYSLTDEYFGKMGMRVRYFMPPGSAAPLAFYFLGDLTEDYTDLELIATISTMETFQKIYRPEIYSANTPAGQSYRPSLDHADYTPTGIVYDREERSRLGVEQADSPRRRSSRRTRRSSSSGLPASRITTHPRERPHEQAAPHLHRRKPAQALLAGAA